MNKPELDLGVFRYYEKNLDDGSTVYDVYFSTKYESIVVANPPSMRCADAIADALNTVRERLLDCGSDREVIHLMKELYEWRSK